jgi:hypothetical protein
MSKNSDKYVRFYFGVSVSCLIPPDPREKRDDVSDDKWDDFCLEKLRVDVEAKLSKEGFDVAYRKHAPIDDGKKRCPRSRSALRRWRVRPMS